MKPNMVNENICGKIGNCDGSIKPTDCPGWQMNIRCPALDKVMKVFSSE